MNFIFTIPITSIATHATIPIIGTATQTTPSLSTAAIMSHAIAPTRNQILIESLTGTGQRQTCIGCSGTFIHFCLRCRQNTEYAESLARDQERQCSGTENSENMAENFHDSNTEEENVNDIRQLRLSKLKFFQ